jgi:predicted Zn-ribbon and HTH transcriptional regulator
LREFVEAYLTFDGRCYRHCDSPSSFLDLRSNPDNVIGAYVCPSGYVSRVVYFGVYSDVKEFKSFLISQVGEEIVTDRDIRPATRHGWELGGDAMAEIGEVSTTGVVKEIYWTVYPKTEDERRRGVFVCSNPGKGRGCNRLFVQDEKSRNRLCPECKQ